MVLTCQLTVVGRNHFKLLLASGLFLLSCSEEPNSKVTFHGVDIDTEHVFVDAVSLDSMFFASGEKRWLLSGVIVINGIEYPYSMIYDRNPVEHRKAPLEIKVPGCFGNTNEPPAVVFTQIGEDLGVSWRTKERFLYVKTVFISER